MSTNANINRSTRGQNLRSLTRLSFILIVCLVLSTACYPSSSKKENYHSNLPDSYSADFSAFESRLNMVREMLKIPGMSAAVVQDQQLVWAAGIGYADLENQVPAGPDTPYGLASVTKPVAAVLIMRLVEQGLIDLDDPVSQYGVDAGSDRVTIRHLLTHTSEGNIGTRHDYNGDRYGLLGGVMEGASGMSFAELLSEEMLLPLQLESTALNPVNSWGGRSSKVGQDFNLLLGAGKGFRHYPDVYRRLAQPYQFDPQYDIIPGMYHLYHNPGAGMISSAADLARIDIALDQGKLLGDDLKKEMFSPAVSTLPGRRDTMYGLGWYIQELEGMHLLWHTGRWSPSTSALYLKVPEQNLTFIVLANTDNLTVPFNGIGAGDISQSALALTFFRYFIFPETPGQALPEIDWRGTEQELVQQLSGVGDVDATRLLERELWSFRQVFASVGENVQAAKLLRVDKRVYPSSTFRTSTLFTNLPGQYPVIPPVISAGTLARISLGIALWFVLVIVSLAIMAVRVLRAAKTSTLGKTIWLAGTLFLGPIAVLVHFLSHPSTPARRNDKWRQALGAAAITATGYAAAWILALVLLTSFGTQPNPLVILGTTYLVPLLASLLFFRIPLQVSHMGASFKEIFKQNFLAEVIAFNLAFATMFSTTWWLSSHLLTTIPQPTSPFFWAMLSVIAFAVLVVLFLLHYWMVQRGFRIPSDQYPGESGTPPLPTLRTAWPSLLATLGIMAAAMAITITQIA